MPDDPLLIYGLLCAAAIAGGAVNSLAGGGTLLTFSALVLVLGGSPEAAVIANATSTVALLPGSLAGGWAYRRELSGSRLWLTVLIWPSFAGAYLGTLLLVRLDPAIFKAAVPWLVLGAATLLAVQPYLSAKAAESATQPGGPTAAGWVGAVFFQFLVAVYGGYFGAGIGIMMLAALGVLGHTDIHRMNALKTLLAAAINAVTAAILIAEGKVLWPYAGAMAISAILGGYTAAGVVRRLDRNLVRRGVVAIGFGLAGWYFWRQFG
jgi:uncharacterized membrane protein YfcA